MELLRNPAFGDSECLPLVCPHCGETMRIIAFVLDPPVIERILRHIGEPVTAPAVLPVRLPPQGELEFDQTAPGARGRMAGICRLG